MPRRSIPHGSMARASMPISSMLRDETPMDKMPQGSPPQPQTPQDHLPKPPSAQNLDSLMCRTSLCSCPEHIPSEAAIYGLMQHPKLTSLDINAAPILYRHYGIPSSPCNPNERNEMFCLPIPRSERKEMFHQLWRLTRFSKDQRICMLRMLDLKFDDVKEGAKRELGEIQERWIYVTQTTAMERMEREYEERILPRGGARDRTVSPERNRGGGRIEGLKEGEIEKTMARNQERERGRSSESSRRDSAILMPPPPSPPTPARPSRPPSRTRGQVNGTVTETRTKTWVPVEWDPLAPAPPPPNPAYNGNSWADFEAGRLRTKPGQLPVGFSDAYEIPRNVRSEAASESAEKRKLKRLEAEENGEEEEDEEDGDGRKRKGKGKRTCEGEGGMGGPGKQGPPPPPPGAGTGTGGSQGKGKGKAAASTPAASNKRSWTTGSRAGNWKGKARASEQEVASGQVTQPKSLIVALKVAVPSKLYQPRMPGFAPAPAPGPAATPALAPAARTAQSKVIRARKQTKRSEESKQVTGELD
ncbi:hypothetical protein BCR34DRAFT_291672 [Clohesyomyces aquaticus]|uniref:Uncharacterized protein n=1 Tax=Clohesyomyces aquaticus TaxID=1231657 RepID=A0A1Y2A8Q5_9PLEO|nr:hypothetical protein BCR34DRAFT_291672 [Clohesyomyces aquaticus]